MNIPVKKAICCICCAAIATCCVLLVSGCSSKSRAAIANGAWKSDGNLAGVAKSTDSLSDDIAAVRAYVEPGGESITLTFLDKKGRDLSTFWKGTFDRGRFSSQVPGTVEKQLRETGVGEDGCVDRSIVGWYREDHSADAQADDSDGGAPSEEELAQETSANNDDPFNYSVDFTATADEGSAYALDSLDFTYNGYMDTLSFNLPLGSDLVVEIILQRDDDANDAIATGQDPFTSSPLSSGDADASAEATDTDDSWAGDNLVNSTRAIEVLKNNKWDESVNKKDETGEDKSGNAGEKDSKGVDADSRENGGSGSDGSTVEVDGVVIEQS